MTIEYRNPYKIFFLEKDMVTQNTMEISDLDDIGPYRSIEQKVGNYLKPVGGGILDFANYFIKGSYGAIVSFFRLPTFFRKMVNDQTTARDYDKWGTGKKGTFILGGAIGAIADISAAGYYATGSADEGKYLPLAIWAGTNLVSGIYEIGRRNQSRIERLALEAQKEKRKKSGGRGLSH